MTRRKRTSNADVSKYLVLVMVLFFGDVTTIYDNENKKSPDPRRKFSQTSPPPADQITSRATPSIDVYTTHKN